MVAPFIARLLGTRDEGGKVRRINDCGGTRATEVGDGYEGHTTP
jgi:hypothetical protein